MLVVMLEVVMVMLLLRVRERMRLRQLMLMRRRRIRMVMNGPRRRRRDGTIHHEQSAAGGVRSLIARLEGWLYGHEVGYRWEKKKKKK